MYDQANRSIWLEDQLWPKMRDAFPRLKSLPENALITVGYPASGARGRCEKIKPAEINTQWTGNSNEQVFISIHPVYFDNPMNIAKALAFQAHKHFSARWGAANAGFTKETDGTITASPDAQTKLQGILDEIGDPPAGYGIAFPVKQINRTRMRRYICDGGCATTGESSHPIIRCASDDLDVTCTCGNHYRLG